MTLTARVDYEFGTSRRVILYNGSVLNDKITRVETIVTFLNALNPGKNVVVP